MHRRQPLLCLMAVGSLAGCAPAGPAALAFAAANIVTLPVFGRGVVDLAYSGVTGRDCSIVRLEQRQSYCVPVQDPTPPPFCTRSLGRVDCWASPEQLPGAPHTVAQAPAPTAGQLADQAERWPRL